jgi:transcriptional regulator with XRE-family HTH domain
MSEPDDLMVIGGWIKRERKLRGWTQPDLAERSGVCKNAVLAAEKGQNSRTLTILWLVEALGGTLSIKSGVKPPTT